MVRFLTLAILLVVLAVVVRAVVTALMAAIRSQGAGRARDPVRALRDELVRDPVCDTYVPRRAATMRTRGSVTRYFCSPACAEKFERP
jgi:YHS domain-containing protein